MSTLPDDVRGADRADLTESADPFDLAEQEREVEPEAGDALPDLFPDLADVDAAEADVLEQTQAVRGDDEEYPFGAE